MSSRLKALFYYITARLLLAPIMLWAIASVVFGLIADRLIAGGLPAHSVRKAALVIGTTGTGVGMLICAGAPTGVALAGLVAAAAFRGMSMPCMYAVAQTFSGPSAGGRWMGWQNFVANLAGIAAPVFTGFVVDRTGSFAGAFAAAAIFCAGAVLCWTVWIGRIEEIAWAGAEPN